jgi:hypothetical protein
MAGCLGRIFARIFRKKGQKIVTNFIRQNASDITISIFTALKESSKQSSENKASRKSKNSNASLNESRSNVKKSNQDDYENGLQNL